MNWNDLKNKAKNYSDAALASLATVSHEVSTAISQTEWMKSINDFKSEISTSMDSEFLKSGISKFMTPNNHRIMDGGHDFFTTISKAQEIGDTNGWSSVQTFEEWAKSYFTDLSSSAGMPMFGKLSDNIYTFLRSLGVDEANARDFVTLNGQEALESVISGGIASVAIIFAWRKEDKETFSRAVGAILCSGTLTMNPASVIVAIIALGFGYNKLVCKEAIARSTITSMVGLSVSALIPGPVLLGVVPAMIAAIYLNKKMGTEFKPIDFSIRTFQMLKSEEFQKNCLALFNEFKGKYASETETTAA